MNERIRTIRLYGRLGTLFGRVHNFVALSPAQALRALCIMIPGFERELMSSGDRGITYAVFRGRENIGEKQLAEPVGNDDIRIAPIIQGRKQAGLFQTVLGAALTAVGYYFGWTGVGAVVGNIGVSLMLGGVAQMISPTQKGLSSSDANNGASYNFNGPVNTQAQGNPVPLLYGRMVVGSAVFSAGIYAEDQA